MERTTIFVVHADVHVRANVSRILTDDAFLVEPFESCAELFDRWPKAGVLLVHDEGDVLLRLAAFNRSQLNRLPFLGFSEQPTSRTVVRAMRTGACGYLEHPFEADPARTAIIDGIAHFRRNAQSDDERDQLIAKLDLLTHREMEVARLIAQGLSYRRIAETLEINYRTVELHKTHIFKKLKIDRVAKLITLLFDATQGS